MKRLPKKKPKPRSDLTAADRAVEEIRAIRRKLWKDAGGTSEGVVAIGRREGAFGMTSAKKKRKPA